VSARFRVRPNRAARKSAPSEHRHVIAPPFKLLGLDHLLLHVRGMAEAERFYCGVLGCSVQHRIPQNAMVELSAGVALVDTADPKGAWALDGSASGRNLDHFAIRIDRSEESAMREWLTANAVEIEEVRDEEDEFSFYVRDPSGNLVELLKRRG
jgi:catechol 2,3-dioxygenase-like lactoylglutathione lyase family enzyme